MAHDAMPDDGVMLLHTITRAGPEEREERKLPVTMTLLRFTKFIGDEIFPGGQIPVVAEVEQFCAEAGFTIERVHQLGEHYARTLDIWAATLEARHADAVALQSEEMYERYMKYLTGCSRLFHDGYTNLCQFTLTK
jgi:cyclopropane-fatty-acyl-phospholipid synthase